MAAFFDYLSKSDVASTCSTYKPGAMPSGSTGRHAFGGALLR